MFASPSRLRSEFSTSQVKPAAAIEHWHHAICQAFTSLDVEPARTGLSASLAWRDVGRLRLLHVLGSPQSVWRSDSMIQADDAAHIILMAHREGSATLLHRGRSVALHPGMLIAMDTLSPYRLTFHQNFRQDVLRLPVSALIDHPAELQQLTATPIPPGFVPEWLAAGLQALRAGSAEAATEAPLLELARLALLSVVPERAQDSASARVNRAKQFIRAHLRRSELGPGDVAQALGISVRQLQKAFAADDDSPAAFILRERLLAAREQLARPQHRLRSISSVAVEWGFADASHFIRSFRRMFDTTPAAWRREQLEASRSDRDQTR